MFARGSLNSRLGAAAVLETYQGQFRCVNVLRTLVPVFCQVFVVVCEILVRNSVKYVFHRVAKTRACLCNDKVSLS